ncbi:glucokinase [Arachidicoccus rhizosphaerae]|uniref:Glucokinase n=1 Tax=Arachidicoccus rhizosphaerae TaxID=551991 RepID=A0A1H4AHW9_9BACT|nr:ROK family protein [Arachidicoccus rhizosphaerae]SEA35599.1 glucokinase [Arachidicoccus rhizosphaerae]
MYVINSDRLIQEEAHKDSWVIGIDFGATQLRAALVSRKAMTDIISKPTPNQGGAGEVWTSLSTLISELLSLHEKVHPVAICVGVPSIVDIETGTVFDIQHIPACKELKLGELIKKNFRIPALVNNDANVFALGEFYFGEADHSQRSHGIKMQPVDEIIDADQKSKPTMSLVGLTLGTGLGAGLILNGKLYSGPNCGAGEIGCMPYLDSNLEDYVSGAFFIKHGVDGKTCFNQARKGESAAIKMYQQFGHHLGQAIKIAMYAYDPDCIVLGGSISQAFDLFEKSMMLALQDFAYPGILTKIKIYPSTLIHGAILGAAALYYDREK